MLKAVLIIVMFHINGEHGTMMREFDSVATCQVAAEEALKSMATIPEIKEGFALCSDRIKLLRDDEGKEMPIEASF